MKVELEAPGATEDIFCTPENNKYYSELRYKPLDEKGKEIRLIKVLPDNGSSCGEIQCELLQNIPLDHVRNKFTALSYCAGSAQNTKTLVVNGIECNIFANLHHALLECRHFWLHHHFQDEFLLWTDQICIHQLDLMERAHQVSFMGEIYRAAEQTLICLATQDRDAAGFDWIQEVLGGAFWESWQVGNLETFSNAFLGKWDRFLDIVTSPWWSRAWVFQEFILSKQPIFLYGWTSMAWDEFDMKLEKVFGPLRRAEAYPFGLEEVFGTLQDAKAYPFKPKLANLIQKSYKAQEQVNRFLTRKDEFTTFSEDGVSHDCIRIATTDHFRPTSDLKTLLYNANFFEASDERDKIYAFLALTNIPHGIVPDYSRGSRVEQLFLEITQKLILIESSIEVLKYSWCSYDKQSCAQSWVVAWTRLNHSKIEGLVFIPDKFLPKNWQADASIEKSTSSPHIILKVWGIKLPNGKFTDPPAVDTDETWILYGLKVPVFLRCVPESSRLHFRLIGPACFIITINRHYVDEMPRVFHSVDAGTLERQRICIL